MTEEKDIALVADYLEGRLDEGEKARVEMRLQEDEVFKALFEELKLLQKGMEHMQHRPLLAVMDRLEEGLDNPLAQKKAETKTVFWTFQRLAAAFIGLAVVAFASWYGLSGSGVDGPALYSEYYEAYENVMVPITRDETEQTLIVRTFTAYELGEYGKADVLFDDLLKEEQPVFVSFYAGLSALEVGENEKGKELLSKVMNTDDVFAVRARWHLALHHLKKEEYTTTITLLETLKESEGSLSARANELLKEIR